MGYGYFETFIIIFLTHPGVIIPGTGGVASKALSYVPSEASDIIPKELTSKLKEGLIPPFISGLWQVMWVWILSLPGEKGPAAGWTMVYFYCAFLVAYSYFIMPIRIPLGV
jgi:hypothetical protein